MASQLEQILGKLLQPDNDVIQKATQDLKEAFKDPSTLQHLCQILSSSQQPQVRQYAAVLIRRKIYKSKQWAALNEEIKQSIRDNILQLLIQEQEKASRSAIAQIVGVVARHDTASNKWPGLFDFLVNYIKSEEAAKREAGMYVLSTVTSVAAEQMKPHMVSLLELLAMSLNDTVIEVAYLSIKSMTDLVFYIGDDEMQDRASMSRSQEVIHLFLHHGEHCLTLDSFGPCANHRIIGLHKTDIMFASSYCGLLFLSKQL